MSDLSVNGVGSVYSGVSNASQTAAQSVKPEAENAAVEAGAVYEKSEEKANSLYSINKMSSEDRATLVQQLKADMENRQSQLLDLVRKTLTGQAETYAKTDDSIWSLFAEGKVTVDDATRAQAQEDISEDGYWGVKQTSQRLFDFASALAGDDEEKMKKMQDAMLEGYKQATAAWGRDLPQISQDTLNAANKLFEDYYASKNVQ